MRQKICQLGLEFLGICLDPELNRRGKGIISCGKVPVAVVSAQTKREIIAQDTYNLVSVKVKPGSCPVFSGWIWERYL